MDITEVRIKLMEESEDRLRAFCSITFDQAFVVRDLKIIEGTNGPFVAMPSRKMTARCGRCGCKNHMRSNYCNQCGTRLRGQDLREVEGAPNKFYADIAHPINQACRDQIQQSVIKEYHLELERAKQPGYFSRYDEEYVEQFPHSGHGVHGGSKSAVPRPHMLEKPREVEPHDATLSQAEAKVVPASEVASEVPEQGDKTEATDFGDGIF
ncbi:MAG: putative septation protein SpoVG [Planctomycetota bacterium]